MQNAGGGFPTSGVVNITFDSAAGSMLPAAASFVSGNYLPSVYGVGVSLPSPAPASPYATSFASIVGANAATLNGSWSLWIADVKTLDSGAINNGWTIQIDV